MSGNRISQCYSDPEDEDDFLIKKELYNEDEEEDDEEWDEEEEEVPVPPLLLGPSSAETTTPTAAMYPSDRTTFLAKQCARLYIVPTELDLRAPNSDQRAHNPPAGYAGIYSDQFKCGLRLPLPTFVVSILAHYGIALAQLHPNGIYNIVGFIKKCEGHSVAPTIGLFREFFRLRRSIKSRGWYTFYPMKQNKIVHGQCSSWKGWKKAFYFFKVSENVSFCWNHSPSMNPLLAEDDLPDLKTVSLLMTRAEGSSSKPNLMARAEQTVYASSKRKYADEDTSMGLKSAAYLRQKRLKRTSESPANEPAKGISGIEDMTTEQFARSIQRSVSSFFNLKLQRQKEELERAGENEIVLLKGDKKELEKKNALLKSDSKDKDKEIASLKSEVKDKNEEVASLKSEVKDKNDEIASLKSKLKSVGEDRGPLLKVYTYKLLKTKGFSRFFQELAKSAQRVGRHLAAKKIQERCPSIPTKAFVGVEDFLAESKLDNLFYKMVQDDAVVFPLLDHLLSLEELPSSSELKRLREDEDENAMTPPPPVPAAQSKK